MNGNHQNPDQRELDEAQLTAHALGQLGQSEQAAVEAKLARDAAARELVDQTGALAEHIQAAGRFGPITEPSSVLREAVERRLGGTTVTSARPSTRVRSSRYRIRRLVAVAAGLLIAAIPLYLVATSQQARQSELALDWLPTSTPQAGSTEGLAESPDQQPATVTFRPAVTAARKAHVPKAVAVRELPADQSSGIVVSDLYENGDDQGVLVGMQQPGVFSADTGIPSEQSRFALADLNQPAQVATGAAGGVGTYNLTPDSTLSGKGGTGGIGWHGAMFGGTTTAHAPGNDGMPVVANGRVIPPGPAGTHFGRRVVDHYAPDMTLRVRRQKGVVDKLHTIESSHVPFPNEPPLAYPDAERWEELTAGRVETYKSMSLARLPKTDPKSDGYGVNKPTQETLTEAPGTEEWVIRIYTESASPAMSREELRVSHERLRKLRQKAQDYAERLGTAHDESVDDYVNEKERTKQINQAIVELERHEASHLALVRKISREEQALRKFERQLLRRAPGTEQYEPIVENAFLSARQQPLSTFSIDVDTASYANVRRFLREGRLPPPAAVRVEEMVNYFKYDYPQPEGDVPFAVDMELAGCPWNTEHRLLRIGIKGREIEHEQRGPSNLVFLLDVSGSMSDGNKLPLVKQAMAMLVEQLGEDDRVAIVTYAGDAGVKLESTGGHERETILAAIHSLSAGGSTHGSAGIQLAYERATSHFIDGGTNRVILATDGDLNVGITDDDQLVKLIQDKAKTGVFLTVLGFGTGNLKDAKLEKLADKGNGIYAYIDSLREARKVLMEQLTGSLMTIAKDVKLQLEFNPAEVKQYRLIGYENRTMAAADFHNDKKDAGEIGAGHTVTALYEIVPADGKARSGAGGEGLKYQTEPEKPLSEAAGSGELLTLKLRYKLPEATESTLLQRTVDDSEKAFAEASTELRFASAVASFGMVLRGSKYCGEVTFSAVEEFAAGAIGDDPGGYRAEFLDLVRRAKELKGR